MSYPRLAARLYNTPLLIEPGKAEVIEAVFRAYASGNPAPLQEIEPATEMRGPVPMKRADGGYGVTDGRVAVMPVHGTLVQRSNGMDALSGLTSYASISQMFAKAEADPDVRAIVLELDSPGGEAAGVFDLGRQFAASKKPVYGSANEMAYSAGYALIVGARAGLYLPEPAMVGSVGVIMMHVDQSQMDAKKGLVYTPIFAGAKKADFSSHAPLSAPAKATAQAEVDRLYQIFVDHVASMRGIDPVAVRGTEAGLLTPGQAIDLRMADGVESFAQTIQRAEDESAPSSFNGYSTTQRRAGALTTMEADMADTQKAPAFTAEDLERARAEGRTAAQAEAETKAKSEREAGAKAAQQRVAAILGHEEAKGRESLAQHLAFNTEQSLEGVVATLKATPKVVAGPVNALADAMGKVPNPKVGADPGKDDPQPVNVISANELYARRRAQAGHGGKAS